MMNYFTLEEAARVLGVAPDEVRKLVERNELRAFRDRGNLRFRSQDIEERARQLGRGSNPDLQPGDVAKPRPNDSPQPKKPDPQVFGFDLGNSAGEKVDLGSLAKGDPPSSKRGARSGSKLGPASPAPKAGSDSDVRLIPTGSDVEFEISADSSVRMVQEPPAPSPKSGIRRKTAGPGVSPQDSGVRIVPLESDSDVKVTNDPTDEGAVILGSQGPKSASDSDIRLHQEPSSVRRTTGGKSKHEPPVTEEIDLDAELREASVSATIRGPKNKSKLKQPPSVSPFELSETNLTAPKSPAPKKASEVDDSSGDFDLTPGGTSPMALDSDEEVSLGELAGRGSGINLQDPADSGISLEKSSSDEFELELSPESGKTPKPAFVEENRDSSSEFELNLAGTTPKPGRASPVEDDSDSEFELSLDAEGNSPVPAKAGADSEFELTLDDSGDLEPLEDGAEERDIFDTDFEVPPLDDESGSQAVALDEDDLDSRDLTEEEDSSSQVMPIPEAEEEEEEEGAVKAVTRTRRRRADDDEEPEVEEEEAVLERAAVAAPTNWGVLPALVLIPCVLVMILVGLMSYELLHGMWGYHQPYKTSNFIIRPIAELFTDDLPKQQQ